MSTSFFFYCDVLFFHVHRTCLAQLYFPVGAKVNSFWSTFLHTLSPLVYKHTVKLKCQTVSVLHETVILLPKSPQKNE